MFEGRKEKETRGEVEAGLSDASRRDETRIELDERRERESDRSSMSMSTGQIQNNPRGEKVIKRGGGGGK